MGFEGLHVTKHPRSGGPGVGLYLRFATTNEEPIDGHHLHSTLRNDTSIMASADYRQ